MYSIRGRLTIFFLLLILCASALGVAAPLLLRNGILPHRPDARIVVFGYTVLDLVILLLALAAIVLLILLMSRITANPVLELDRAMKEVARGNFDVRVTIRRRTTEYASLQQSFNAMTAELKSNEYLRRDFLSNVSHEFKTPLSVINGYARLLTEPELDDAARAEYASYIAAESARLSHMTENMLRISRLDAKKSRPVPAPFALDEQLRRTVLLWDGRIEEKKLGLEMDVPPLSLTADKDLLFHVWSNLIDNAVKFTPAGGRVRISASEDGGAVTVTVADSGVGMDDQTRQNAFYQFYRGTNAAAGDGSGLGLPLAKRIVELHGGSIRVLPEAQGNAFTVVLPKA
jgi:signal transduction histidine kinase